MKTSIVNLRYKMKDVLKALARKERVEILYHGRPKGVIIPAGETKEISVKDHPFFGMLKTHKKTVEQTMKGLRKGRYAV